MSTLGTIAVESRTGKGSTACRRLRREGRVPANVYGRGDEAVTGALAAETALSIATSGTQLVDLDVCGKAEKALVREIQWNTFSTEIVHIDFMRVDANQRVRVEVPVHVKGLAPGVIAGGILEQPLHTLEIECLAVAIPSEIFVRVAALKIGEALHVNELTEVPPGVTITTPGDQMILHIVAPRAEAEPEPAEEEAETTEG